MHRVRTGGPALAAAVLVLATVSAAAHPAREPFRIEVPDRPLRPDTTQPILYTCSDMEDCQSKARQVCGGINYPNGTIEFQELAESPRPFPIYSVVCFD